MSIISFSLNLQMSFKKEKKNLYTFKNIADYQIFQHNKRNIYYLGGKLNIKHVLSVME